MNYDSYKNSNIIHPPSCVYFSLYIGPNSIFKRKFRKVDTNVPNLYLCCISYILGRKAQHGCLHWNDILVQFISFYRTGSSSKNPLACDLEET